MSSAPSGEAPAPRDGRELMSLFLPNSPFVAKLGIVPDLLGDDQVVLRMPWDAENVTVGDMVHGGALAALADATVMAAAWSGAPLPGRLRGVTTSLALEFLAPARATDVLAEGRVLRRGRSQVNVEVDLTRPEGERIAKAIGAYRLG